MIPRDHTVAALLSHAAAHQVNKKVRAPNESIPRSGELAHPKESEAAGPVGVRTSGLRL
jgi:hypothetical protein